MNLIEVQYVLYMSANLSAVLMTRHARAWRASLAGPAMIVHDALHATCIARGEQHRTALSNGEDAVTYRHII